MLEKPARQAQQEKEEEQQNSQHYNNGDFMRCLTSEELFLKTLPSLSKNAAEISVIYLEGAMSQEDVFVLRAL